MSWALKKKAQALIALEEGVVRKDWGGKVSFALVYPNTYSVGMSNLGFQTIYHHLNLLPDVVCERVFLPDPGDSDEYRRASVPPFSLESQRPLSDFHLIGFSVTYEGDYINVLRLLGMAGIPLRSEERGPSDPMVLMGGVCAFSNPEPLAPFMDFVVVGEGEEIVGEIVAAYRAPFGEGAPSEARSRRAFLKELAAVPGVYVPQLYEVDYASDGTVGAVVPKGGAPPVVAKRRLKDVNAFETISVVRTPKAEYGHMTLLEVGKGCGRGCRFCLEGHIYRPVRHRSLGSLSDTAKKIAGAGKRVGLVGACVSDYPWIGDLMRVLVEHGVEVSISSLRADSLTEELVASLKMSGHRTLTLAPETGTERLRGVIRKTITDEQLYAACDIIRRHGIPNLRCYFMIGLPGETMDDIEAIPDLASRLLARLKARDMKGRPFGKLTLSVSSYVPKPWTPFQWAQFDDLRSLEEKLSLIKKGARRLSNVRVLHENPREAALQALLARGDRRVSELLEIAARLEGDWRRALREWTGDPAFYTTRKRALSEIFPWDHFDVGVKKEGLIREYRLAGLGSSAADGPDKPLARELSSQHIEIAGAPVS
jgi:radical SAM family uncharacterized protein